MLVYLDSAQLAWLERASAPQREAFRAICEKMSAEIVVSLEHIVEIGQLATPANAAARARSLAILPYLRSAGRSSLDVARWEIRQQLSSIAGLAHESEDVFRQRLFPRCTAYDLAKIVVDEFSTFQAMRVAFIMGAEAETVRKAASAEPPARMRAPSTISADQIALAREIMASHIDDPHLLNQMDALIDRVLPHVAGRTHREALLSLLELDDLPAALRAPEKDLTILSTYFATAKEEAFALVGAVSPSSPAAKTLARAFDPYRCKGIRLRLAVNRARYAHPSAPKPSDQLDEGHLMFAPYVDLMCVDKRTHAYLRQEVRRSATLCDSSDTENLIVPRTLEQVITTISSFGATQ